MGKRDKRDKLSPAQRRGKIVAHMSLSPKKPITARSIWLAIFGGSQPSGRECGLSTVKNDLTLLSQTGFVRRIRGSHPSLWEVLPK